GFQNGYTFPLALELAGTILVAHIFIAQEPCAIFTCQNQSRLQHLRDVASVGSGVAINRTADSSRDAVRPLEARNASAGGELRHLTQTGTAFSSNQGRVDLGIDFDIVTAVVQHDAIITAVTDEEVRTAAK